MGKALLHEGVLGLLHLLRSNTKTLGNSLLSLNDQDFSVGEVLDQRLNVLLGLLEEISLPDSRLLGESPVLLLDEVLRPLHDLGVGLDVEGIDSTRQVLDLDAAGYQLQLALIEVVFEGRNELLGTLSSHLVQDSALHNALLEKGSGLSQFGQKSLISICVRIEKFLGFSPKVLGGFNQLKFFTVELEPVEDGLECLLGEFLGLDGLDKVGDIIALELFHGGDEAALLDIPEDAKLFGQILHLARKLTAALGKALPADEGFLTN